MDRINIGMREEDNVVDRKYNNYNYQILDRVKPLKANIFCLQIQLKFRE